jgi:hypothetical protein
MSATDRAVANSTGVDMMVPLEGSISGPVNIVIVTRLPHFKPPRLAATPVVQVKPVMLTNPLFVS